MSPFLFAQTAYPDDPSGLATPSGLQRHRSSSTISCDVAWLDLRIPTATDPRTDRDVTWSVKGLYVPSEKKQS